MLKVHTATGQMLFIYKVMTFNTIIIQIIMQFIFLKVQINAIFKLHLLL